VSSPTTIFIAALITEGLLIIVSYVVSGLMDVPVIWGADPLLVVLGALAAFPLLWMNHFAWRWAEKRPDSLYARFSREIVVPLCKQVKPPLALVLGVLSGFGEELFFRGVLNSLVTDELGAVVSAISTSVLFAYVHFIGQERRFGGMIPLYSAVGLYIWTLVTLTGSLTAAMVCHGLYNFLAIVSIRKEVSKAAPSRLGM
jgi:hypothetical protein